LKAACSLTPLIGGFSSSSVKASSRLAMYPRSPTVRTPKRHRDTRTSNAKFPGDRALGDPMALLGDRRSSCSSTPVGKNSSGKTLDPRSISLASVLHFDAPTAITTVTSLIAMTKRLHVPYRKWVYIQGKYYWESVSPQPYHHHHDQLSTALSPATDGTEYNTHPTPVTTPDAPPPARHQVGISVDRTPLRSFVS
jgi:hypothetical protein